MIKKALLWILLSGLVYAGTVDMNLLAKTGYSDGFNSGMYNTLNQSNIKKGSLKPMCLFRLKGTPRTKEEANIIGVYRLYYKKGYISGMNTATNQLQQQQMQQQIQLQQQIQQQQMQQQMQQQIQR